MQNKLLIYGITGVVLVLGIVAFAMNKSDSPVESVDNETSEEVSSNSSEASLKDLIANGGSNKCTFSQTVENSKSDGVVYLQNGAMRGDFTSVAGGQTIKSHMIVRENTTYVWSDMASQGVKMSFDAAATSAASSTGGVSIDQKLAYSCDGWSGDAGMFSLPSEITFTDLSSMIPGGSTNGSSANSYQCNACASITDADGKAQCKAMFNCQ